MKLYLITKITLATAIYFGLVMLLFARGETPVEQGRIFGVALKYFIGILGFSIFFYIKSKTKKEE